MKHYEEKDHQAVVYSIYKSILLDVEMDSPTIPASNNGERRTAIFIESDNDYVIVTGAETMAALYREAFTHAVGRAQRIQQMAEEMNKKRTERIPPI